MRLLSWCGALMNAIGIPGLVRDSEYRSETPRCHVRVRRGRTFTVVSVNGVDVYFGRLTGRIDGCATALKDKSVPAG